MVDSDVSELLEVLNSQDTDAIVKACEKLAIMEDMEAIEGLSTCYELAEDKKVKAAAGKALKAITQANSGGSSGGGIFKMLTLLLTVTLVALVAGNVALRVMAGDDGDSEDTPSSGSSEVTVQEITQELPDRPALLIQLKTNLDNIALDSVSLLTEWDVFKSSGQLPCNATLEEPAPIELTDFDLKTLPDFEFSITQAEAARALQRATLKWHEACGNPENLDADETISQINEIISLVNQVDADIQQATNNPMPTSTPPEIPAAEATIAPADGSPPTAILTATPSPTDEVVGDLERLLAQADGAMQELVDLRWQKVKNDELPVACTRPRIPDEYTKYSPEALVYNNSLALAVWNFNEGVKGLRAVADVFEPNCPDGLKPFVDDALAQAEAARQNFATAATELENAKQGQ